MAIDSATSIKENIVQYITPKQPVGVLSSLSDMKFKLQEVIENLTTSKTQSPKNELEQIINEKFLDLDFAAEFDIDTAKIGVNDAIFFVNLLNRENLINYSVDSGSITINSDGKEIKATNSLLSVLENSYTTNKPVRLDFDKDITVIIKLDKDGKVQAHFIPGSPEVESYLKNNIPSLKQRFDDEKINYSHLGYKSSGDKNSKKQKRSSK